MMRFWNGHGFDEVGKDVKTKKDVANTVAWVQKTLSPFQISITDLDGKDPIENPTAKILEDDWIRIKADK